MGWMSHIKSEHFSFILESGTSPQIPLIYMFLCLKMSSALSNQLLATKKVLSSGCGGSTCCVPSLRPQTREAHTLANMKPLYLHLTGVLVGCRLCRPTDSDTTEAP